MRIDDSFQTYSSAADRVFPDRGGAGTASVAHDAQAHGPGGDADRGSRAGGERPGCRDAVDVYGWHSGPVPEVGTNSRPTWLPSGRQAPGNVTTGPSAAVQFARTLDVANEGYS